MCRPRNALRSSARDIFIAERIYLVPNSVWDWEPVERLKHSSDNYGQFYVFFRLRRAAPF